MNTWGSVKTSDPSTCIWQNPIVCGYCMEISALKSGPVPVLGSSGLGPWTGPVLIFPNMEGPRTGPHKTGFMRPWAVLGPVLVKTDS